MEAEVTVAKLEFGLKTRAHSCATIFLHYLAPNLRYLCFKSNDQVDIFISLYSELFTSELILHSYLRPPTPIPFIKA